MPVHWRKYLNFILVFVSILCVCVSHLIFLFYIWSVSYQYKVGS
jgi:hypothetical protein